MFGKLSNFTNVRYYDAIIQKSVRPNASGSYKADPNLRHLSLYQQSQMGRAAGRHVWRDTRRCSLGARFQGGLNYRRQIQGETSTRDGELTEIPLPSSKHLEHAHDE